MDINRLLDEDRVAWEELVSVTETHPHEVLDRAASPWKWTSHDVYAHLARWIPRFKEDMKVRFGITASI